MTIELNGQRYTITNWHEKSEAEKQAFYKAVLEPDANVMDVIFDAHLTIG